MSIDLIINFILNIISGFVAVDFVLLFNHIRWTDNRYNVLIPFVYGIILTIINSFVKVGLLETVLIIAMLYCISMVLNRDNKIKSFFYILLFYVTMMCVNLATALVSGFLFNINIDDIIESNQAIIYGLVIVTKVILFVICRLYAVFINRKSGTSILEMLIYIIYPLVTIMVICFIFNVIYAYDIKGLYNTYAVFLMIMLLIANIFVVCLYNLRVNSLNRENELKQKLIISDYAVKNLKSYQEALNVAKKIKHDIKNHITIIKCYLQDRQYDKAMEYTDIAFENIDAIGTYLTLNNQILTYLLNSKLQIAKNKNIDIKVSVDQNTHNPLANEYDLCSIYGNILDNAIENTETNGQIHIDIKEVNGYHKFSVKNSILKSILKDNPDLKTSKNDNKNHGLGMGIIVDVLEKNNGMLDVYEENNKFCVSAYLPY